MSQQKPKNIKVRKFIPFYLRSSAWLSEMELLEKQACQLFGRQKNFLKVIFLPFLTILSPRFNIKIKRYAYHFGIQLVRLSLYCFYLFTGQDEYNRLRVLSYPDTQVFCLCFSLVDRKTFDHVKTAWKLELDHHCPGIPIVLVGTKLDLREECKDQSKKVTNQEGEKMKQEINAYDMQSVQRKRKRDCKMFLLIVLKLC